AFGTQLGDGGAGHDACGGLGQGYRCGLGDERYGARGARVGLQNVEHTGGERVLDVDQPEHSGAAGNGLGGVADAFDVLTAKGDRGQGTRRVAGVDTRFLDVLHDATEVQVMAVVEGVHVDLDGVVEETVDAHGVLGADLRVAFDVVGEHLIAVDDLHTASAQHVGGADHDRVTDLVGRGLGLLEGVSGAVLGCGQPCPVQDLAELATILGQVDGFRAGADDGHPGFLESAGQAQRGLATQLHDDPGDRAGGLFGPHDLQNVLQGERLEVEPVTGVVVGG